MDIQKIGEFLRKLRKQNNMTQEQLGERLHVTNKTVSRWETGKYMPPIECLKLLSDIYQISVNEILTGGNLDEEDFKEAAENNISDTLEEIEAKGKKFENTIFIIMGLTSLLAIFSMFLLPNGSKLTGMEKVKEIIVVLFIWVMALISNSLGLMTMLSKKTK
ncbi:helix-turn-helix transcriptional regulator [Listeria monocytogenes]|uniref:helix-turn-helix domain-containing protein n=1 Tax=Listeria monocytogenes TaxID=1639 RepID=UPI000F12BCFD|nr:helix-turn-helix transcriptional regulator [Listeria monocytogenes]EAC3456865.1 XRE family transcriptional regulator [Listeria monocytogenes]EAC4365825.1 XRE family transcriptional regulator [Listeria monocytogenes]EAC4831116.1 XRE family transcriptional regulator [Listeria monocytogenes]EAC5025198.1 XRE family transcriptional regulator [Listeria monocytogenes]EAC6175385.1 XRE family transcriptional regulator [Listeria monocytogenes]